MALGGATFTDLGGAVSDFYGAQADKSRASGDLLEAQNYGLAAGFADQNAIFTQWSTAIKGAQQDREVYMNLSQQGADVGGSGLSQSGSALDVLRDSASQGALQRAVLGEQGQSYTNMQLAATQAASAENKAATGAYISGGIKAAAGIATLFT